MTTGAGWYLVHEILVVFTRMRRLGWGRRGAQRGGPRIPKTECFTPEFLGGKETVDVNWESGAADGVQARGGVRPVDDSLRRNSPLVPGSDFELGSQAPHHFPSSVPGDRSSGNHLFSFTPFAQLLHLGTRVGLPHQDGAGRQMSA